jgi:hypothetical protein
MMQRAMFWFAERAYGTSPLSGSTSLRFDAGGLDDRPPFLDLGPLKGAERLRGLPVTRIPPVPTDALSGLAFNQAIRPFRSFAGIVLFATNTNGPAESRATGSKSFSKSYWSA